MYIDLPPGIKYLDQHRANDFHNGGIKDTITMQIITKQYHLVFPPQVEMEIFDNWPFLWGIWPIHETPMVVKIMNTKFGFCLS